MITAFVEDYKVFGEASGRVDALLLKPFAFEDLREAIEQVLPYEELDQIIDAPQLIEPSPLPDIISPPKP